MPILDIFLLKPQAVIDACENRRAPLWISAFIILTGVIYGILVALLQRSLGGELQGIPIADIPLWVLMLGNILPGVLITIMIHIGIMLVAWLMAKALGGRGELGLLYRAGGYLLPLTLPALPAVAFTVATTTTAHSAGAGPIPWLYLALAVAGAASFLAGLYQMFRVTQNFQSTRALFATALFAAFSVSILSLA
ncbi:MAG: YIP1 family protein [Candidatus Competibacteraceae bacterium]|nr:YIP1 family protein [Candidatus Competibacteraceae bacterium]